MTDKEWLKSLKENLTLSVTAAPELVQAAGEDPDFDDEYYEAFNLEEEPCKECNKTKNRFLEYEDQIVECGKKILQENGDLQDGIQVASESELPPYGHDNKLWLYDWENLPTNVECTNCGTICRTGKAGDPLPKEFGGEDNKPNYLFTAFYEKDLGWICGHCLRNIAFRRNGNKWEPRKDVLIREYQPYNMDNREYPEGLYKSILLLYTPGLEPSRKSPNLTKVDYSAEEDDITEDYSEETVTCEWCGEELPKSEAKYEKDLGWLCDRCTRGIISRGEELDFEDNKF